VSSAQKHSHRLEVSSDGLASKRRVISFVFYLDVNITFLTGTKDNNVRVYKPWP